MNTHTSEQIVLWERTSSMRERAWNHGVDGMNDTELLALLLGQSGRSSPVMTLAERLLEHAGGLHQLEELGMAGLCQLSGLGPATALRLAACWEIGRRVRVRRAAEKPLLHTASAVARHFTLRIGDARQEQLWVASLDAKNRMRGARQIAVGGQNMILVTPRDILCAALRDAASGFVLVHNHPSGDAAPSSADIRMTLTVARASLLVDMPLLDHVVVTTTGNYTSMAELGVLPLPPT